jgi:hypothetical protein
MALFAVFALAAAFAATSAMAALPDVHLLSGEAYPATGSGSVTGKEAGEVVGKLETELGEKLTATGVSTSVELLELSSLGPGELVFTGVLEPKKSVPCHTVGAKNEGEVVLPGEYHVVVAAEKQQAVLVLFKELTVECNSGKLKVKVRSPALIHLNVTAGTDVTTYGISAKCGTKKGKQDMTEYLNDEEKLVKGQLTANFGLGFETACDEVNQEMTVTSSKMVDFLF